MRRSRSVRAHLMFVWRALSIVIAAAIVFKAERAKGYSARIPPN